jgi:hypothetical protein
MTTMKFKHAARTLAECLAWLAATLALFFLVLD